jgi:hypothetical protein
MKGGNDMSENSIVTLHKMGFNPDNLAFYIKLDTEDGSLCYELAFIEQSASIKLTGEDALEFQGWVQCIPRHFAG